MLGSQDEKPVQSPLEATIDEHLRRVYEEALGESVPERFRALLEELRKKGSEK